MRRKWLSLGFDAKDIIDVNSLLSFLRDNMIDYIYDIHFPHYDPRRLPTGRISSLYCKSDLSRFLEMCKDFDIKTTLLLNYGDYDYGYISKQLEEFYLKSGLNFVVVSDTGLIKYIKKNYPQLEIQGSCISHRDTIEGLMEEATAGVTLHNPAVWTIRDPDLIHRIHKKGLRQKHIFSEGCARKCPLEKWHRNETLNGNHPKYETSCKRSIKNISTLLMGSWVTMKQLKRMEAYIDVLKLPRFTFQDFSGLKRFVELYDNNIPYNILDYFSTPIIYVRDGVKIMSDIFDDEFFDNTVSDEIDEKFLIEYIKRIGEIKLFKESKSVLCGV